VAVVHPDKYIQHNPQTHEGGVGLAELFSQLSKSSPRVNIVRVFSDGDYVFAHTEYDFSNSNIGFEAFRFEGDQTVEPGTLLRLSLLAANGKMTTENSEARPKLSVFSL
jgi:predicted SnoaL-like aldol condensation-catalyzing enzyme